MIRTADELVSFSVNSNPIETFECCSCNRNGMLNVSIKQSDIIDKTIQLITELAGGDHPLATYNYC